MRNTLKIIAFTSLLGGCSGYGGEWPSLNDPLPDESERQRIFATADIKVMPESFTESETMDLKSHKAQQSSIAWDMANAWQIFNEKLESIDKETDPEDKLIAWTGSQLALSRVSAIINKFRDLQDIPIEPSSIEAENHLIGLKRAIWMCERDLAEARALLEIAKPK